MQIPPIYVSSFYNSSASTRSENNEPQRIKPEDVSNALRNIEIPDLESQRLGSIDTTPMVVFKGNGSYHFMYQSEKTDRMQAILGRLTEEQGNILIDLGLLRKDEFLDFAEGLSETDFQNFADTTLALTTRPQRETLVDNFFNSGEAIKDFFNSLQNMDTETVSRVLAKTKQLSAGVPIRDFSETYNAIGKLKEGSAAANELQSFVRAISTLEPSEVNSKTNEFLDHLQFYADDQQADLIQVAGMDLESAMRAMTQFQGYDKTTQDAAFSFLADLTRSIKSYAHPPPVSAENPYAEAGKPGWSGSLLGIHSDSKEVVLEMVDEFVTLTENYVMSDDQITTMSTKLSSLDNENRRTYLSITSNGLASLLGGDTGSPGAAHNRDDVFEAIDQVRNSVEARFFISEVGQGTKYLSSNGKYYYASKSLVDSERDEAKAIDLLVTDAWLNRGDSVDTGRLSTTLGSLGAEQRDDLLDRLESFSAYNDPLYQLSTEEQIEDYAQLSERLAVIKNTSSLSELLRAEETIGTGHENAFWKAANFLEKDADTLVNAINNSNPEGGQLVVGLVVSLADAVEHEELTRDQALGNL